jgi:predicted N-acetyltransferase YhbS
MKPQELKDGLIMRNANESDIPAIIDHFRAVHGEGVVDQLGVMLRNHPGFSWDDSFIITNESGAVVSCVMLLQKTWVLDGIEIPSVEMEAVGTLESYRYRGLIRLLNDEFEKRASELDPVLMTIAGIPEFYRNFGYEYAASLGGGYPVAPALIPKPPEEEKDKITFKEVDVKSFPEFLKFRAKYKPRQTWYRKMVPEDAEYLIYETTSPKQEAFYFYLVKDERKTVGVFFLARWENRLDVLELYLDSHKHVDTILRFALRKADEWNGIPVRVAPPNQARVKEYVSARTQAMAVSRYAWYVKIPSIPRFIESVAPLFPDRLKETEFHDFNGDLTFTTYKEGFTLTFERGTLKGTVEKEEKDPGNYHLRIPKNQLTRLLMGYETLDEIMSHEPDVTCAATLRPLVRLLFPKLMATVDPFY